jgi:transcriptional regulator with XRE-family HTH domain
MPHSTTPLNSPDPKFGAFVRDRRTAKGFSLRKFAELVGISPTYLSHIEQGKVETPPTAERVAQMARILDENADVMIAMAGRVSDDLPGIIRSQPEAVPALLRSLKGLSVSQLQELQKKADEFKKEGKKK